MLVGEHACVILLSREKFAEFAKDAEFADVRCALPKVVSSRTLASGQGNARLARGSLAEEAAEAIDATDKDVGIGGAGLAAAAIDP